jgi:CBS domain-containing protein
VKEVASDEPKPLQKGSSVREASEKMRSLKTDELPVASGDLLVGTVVGKDSDRKAAGFGHDPATTPVQGIMAKQRHYCFEEQSVDEARAIMLKYQLKHLPVVDKDLRIVGTVALSDITAGKRSQKKSSRPGRGARRN